MKKQIICLLLVLILVEPSMPGVVAEEIQPYSSNIGYLGTSISVSGSCLLGSVTGSFTGSDMHAIYYCEFQYLTSYGEYATIGDQRSFRSYTSIAFETFETYYCNPIPGVQYRFHTNMKVYNSDGIIKDSDVINSNSIVW